MNVQDNLSQLNNAINAIEQGAQEYQLGSRRIKKAELSVLYSERRRLQQEAIGEQNFGGISVACFDRR